MLDRTAAEPVKETRLLPAIAEAVAEWFPELQGRAFAVSDAQIDKSNVPTLPLCMVVLARSVFNPTQYGSKTVDRFTLEDLFLVEFWLRPERYKRPNGTETPFWSYYPYETIRSTLLNNFIRWQAPNCERIVYQHMSIVADALAVTISFTFKAVFQWGAQPAELGEPIKQIGFCLQATPGCIEDCVPCPDPCA